MSNADPHTIRVRPAAARDLEEIVKYFDVSSPNAANRFMQAYDTAVKLLAIHPGGGQLIRQRGPMKGLRSWPLTDFRSYLVLYFPLGEVGIEVARVVHGARNLGRLLRNNGNRPKS